MSLEESAKLKTNPWTRPATEAAVIVLSILAAFAIEAWWAEVQANAGLDQILARVEAGLVDSRGAIGLNVDSASADAARLRSFLAMSPIQAEATPSDSTFDVLEAIWRPHTMDNNLTFLRSALDDESLSRLDDVAVQDALVRWREDLDQLSEIGVSLAAAQNEALRALGRHPEVGLLLAGELQAVSAEAMRQTRADRDVFAVGARKAFLVRIQLTYLLQLQAHSDSLLQAVRSARTR